MSHEIDPADSVRLPDVDSRGVSFAHCGRSRSTYGAKRGLDCPQPQVAKRVRRERDPQRPKPAIVRALLA